MLNPPSNLLSPDEAEIVVEVMRESGDFGAANRELKRRFPEWDEPRRLAGLRQAQNKIFKAWEKNPARKRRAQLVGGHGPEVHKEGSPENEP